MTLFAGVKAMTFSDGTRVELDRRETLLLVGPNNAGKSATLREISGAMAGAHQRQVLSSVEVEFDGEPDAFIEWLSAHRVTAGLNTPDQFIKLGHGGWPADLIKQPWSSRSL